MLPDDPHVNAHWVTAQVKLHPAVVISCAEYLFPDGSVSKFASLTNPTGAAIEVESYLPLSELELLEQVTSLPGLHVKLLPLPADWPKRPQGGFLNDSQGFSEE